MTITDHAVIPAPTTPAAAVRVAQISCALRGCTCSPDIEVTQAGVTIAHDDWCPVMSA